MTDIDTSIYRTAPAKSGIDQINDLVGMQNGMQDLQRKKLDMAVGQQRYISNVLGSLYGKPDLSADDIIREGSKAVQMGIIPQQQFGVMLQGLPQDPAQLRQWVGGMALRAASAGEQLEAHAGRPGTTDTGAGIYHTTQSPMTGAINVAPGNAAYVPRQISPEGAMSRVEGQPDDQGRPTQRPAVGAAVEAGTVTPQGTVNAPPVLPVPSYGGNRLVAPPAPPQQPNKLNVQPPVRPAPVRPSQPAPAPAPVSQAPAPAPPAVAGDLSRSATASQPIGLPPGQADAMKVTGAASGELLAQDQTHAAKITENLFPLKQSISALERLGQTGTGPGTEQANAIKSFLVSAGVPGVDVNKIKDFDEAKKYLTDYVNRTGNSGTNDKLAAAFAGNPSVNISNAAAVDVAKSAAALARMRAAQASEFAKTGKPASEYSAWSANWNKTQDPRAYGADFMGPAKVTMLRNRMNPDEQKRFAASLVIAHKNDLMTAGGQ